MITYLLGIGAGFLVLYGLALATDYATNLYIQRRGLNPRNPDPKGSRKNEERNR